MYEYDSYRLEIFLPARSLTAKVRRTLLISLLLTAEKKRKEAARNVIKTRDARVQSCETWQPG